MIPAAEVSNPGSRRKVFGPNLAPGATTHAGLWLDRFLLDPEAKGAGAGHLASLSPIRVPPRYRAFCERRREGLKSLRPKTLFARATVAGRLVVGLGQESVLETSVTLHRVWGVPYLPGSALKGLAGRAARERLDPPWNPGEEGGPYSVVFGRLEDAGFVTFHDALWIPVGDAPPLDADVLTVHHPDYYGGKDALPVEWDEPNPVAFATCRGTYEIALTGPAGWVEKAMEILLLALEQDGLGAKTGQGYGRFATERPAPPIRDAWEPQVGRIQIHNGGSIVEKLWRDYEGEERVPIAREILRRLERKRLKKLREPESWVDRVFSAAGE